MYTEVLKIIEGGMNNDISKVINYSKSLAQKIESEGNKSFSNKILKIVDSQNLNLVRYDSLATKPVDKESNLETVNVVIPTEQQGYLVFNEFIENEIKDFILTYYKKDELIKKGLNVTHSLLLHGPPGTGKTSLAQYISFQLNLPLIVIKLDSLISSRLGNTAKNIRKVFEYASNRPCVLFLDEFDVIAKVRDDHNDSGELKRVVNSLIQNIDEFSNESILLAATNHAELLDNAVWRRFDKVLELKNLDFSRRLKIIKNELENFDVVEKFSNKEIEQFAKLTDKLAPSLIKLVITNSVKKSIIYEYDLGYYHLLFELYLRENPSLSDNDNLVSFLYENGLSQRQIAFYTKIPIRKVRATINKGV